MQMFQAKMQIPTIWNNLSKFIALYSREFYQHSMYTSNFAAANISMEETEKCKMERPRDKPLCTLGTGKPTTRLSRYYNMVWAETEYFHLEHFQHILFNITFLIEFNLYFVT